MSKSQGVTKRLRILVTGGAGFLGSNLCERLVRAGHDVYCLDNLFTSEKSNIQHLLNEPNFSFFQRDVTEPLHFEVDWIYHLACPASPPHYQARSIDTLKTCVMGAFNVAELGVRTGARVFFSSTSEVYGDPDEAHHPQQESYRGNVSCTGVRACYDEGKRCAETIFLEYQRKQGLDIRIVRIFNTYGPKMHPYDGRVVTNFILQALRNEPITIYGEGTQTRSFCYVDDLLDGFELMMQNGGWTGAKLVGATEGRGLPEDTGACGGCPFYGPVNLGNPGEFTIAQLAELVVKLTGSKSEIVKKPLPADDPLQRKPDISLAKEKLGWEPKVQLEEGLKRAIEYFSKLNLDHYRKPTEFTHHSVKA